MKDFYLWDLELVKFRRGQDSITEKQLTKKELRQMFPPPGKIYNPEKLPVYKLKIWNGEICLGDGSKVY